ncbi:MAG: hypothetical protein ACHP65_08520 [Legionellales bacterium]
MALEEQTQQGTIVSAVPNTLATSDPLITPKLTQSLKDRVLAALNQYITDLDKRKGEYGSGFFSKLGFNKQQKMNAAKALRDAVIAGTGNVTEHLPTIRQGRLGDILRTIAKDVMGKRGTVRLLVAQLTTSSAASTETAPLRFSGPLT